MSVHRKGRVCVLDDVDFENLSRGVEPNCREHRHISRSDAFYLSRKPDFGKLLAIVAARGSTKENPIFDGCFVEVAGTVEYAHVRKRTKPKLEWVYALGERIASERQLPFVRRKLHEYLRFL